MHPIRLSWNCMHDVRAVVSHHDLSVPYCNIREYCKADVDNLRLSRTRRDFHSSHMPNETLTPALFWFLYLPLKSCSFSFSDCFSKTFSNLTCRTCIDVLSGLYDWDFPFWQDKTFLWVVSVPMSKILKLGSVAPTRIKFASYKPRPGTRFQNRLCFSAVLWFPNFLMNPAVFPAFFYKGDQRPHI